MRNIIEARTDMFREVGVRNGGGAATTTTTTSTTVGGERRRRELQEVIGAHPSMHLKKGFHEGDLNEGGGNREQRESSKNPSAKVPAGHHNPRRTAHNPPTQRPAGRRRPVLTIMMVGGVANHISSPTTPLTAKSDTWDLILQAAAGQDLKFRNQTPIKDHSSENFRERLKSILRRKHTMERRRAVVLAPANPASSVEVLVDEVAALLEVVDAFDAVTPPHLLAEDLGLLDVDPLLTHQVLPHLQRRNRVLIRVV
nr:hypothetical protein Iba_chr11eCG13210 [Ipomoea batatas]